MRKMRYFLDCLIHEWYKTHTKPPDKILMSLDFYIGFVNELDNRYNRQKFDGYYKDIEIEVFMNNSLIGNKVLLLELVEPWKTRTNG